MRRWLKTVPVAILVVSTGLGAASWFETRYAKAADIDKLKGAINSLASELKAGQLENRRTVLRGEQFQLKNVARPTNLERARLNEVENELHDVEQQLERLFREKEKP